MTFTIRKATLEHLEDLFHILDSCTDWLSRRGMDHWQGAHTRERIRTRITEKNVFLAVDTDKFVGTITLSLNPPQYYPENSTINWKDPTASAMYISALAVLPSYHGKGLASLCLSFAEQQAKEKGLHYVRFDAIAQYTELTTFYVQRGYTLVGKNLTGAVESNFFEKCLRV